MTATAAPRRATRADGGVGGDGARPRSPPGCRFFAGYPMTPFTELLEHFAKRLPDVGGVCINAESELEAVGMAWGALADRRPRRDRLDRPGPLAHAGVVLARSRSPSCRS